MKTRMMLAAACLPAAVIWLSGCGGGQSGQARAATEVRDPLEIEITPELERRIQTGKPRVESVSAKLQVAGRVEADETRMARVGAPVTGRILEINAIEGQMVKRGDTLATIYSMDLSSAQSAFLKARSQQEVAERAVARARQLLAAGVIGEAELQRRDAERMQAAADVAAAREQLGVLGLSPEDIRKVQESRALTSQTRIPATIDGIVLERKATIGQLVQAVETIFVIADLSKVWLVADVPEQSAGALAIGKGVQAEIPALPYDKITGRLSFVSATVNPETRTVRTRMDLPNPRHRYKPSMLTTMTLVDGAEPQVVVPAAAVVREDNTDYVFVQAGPKKFRLKAVTLGEEVGDLRVVNKGLAENEMIVAGGAFHLNNERKRLAIESSGGA